MAEYVLEQQRYYYPSSVVAQVVNGIIGLIELMLALRIVLQIVGANPSASFIGWIYSVSDSLAGPFVNAFPSPNFANGAINLTMVFAMIGYAIIGWLIIRLLSLLFAV